MTDRINRPVKESTVDERADALAKMSEEIHAVLEKYDQISILEKLGYFEAIKWLIIKDA